MAALLKTIVALVSATSLAGCTALTVPEVQEFWGAPGDTTQKIANIVYQVKCELGNAVRENISVDKTYNNPRVLKFMENWIADLLIIITIDEKGNASPSFSVIKTLSSMQSKTFGINANLSSEVIRSEKIHVFYRFSDFLAEKTTSKDCHLARPAEASLFVESDLKISEWLNFSVVSQMTQDGASYGNLSSKTLAAAFTHDIKFEIISSGGITPTWKLVDYGTAANGMGSTLGSSRDRAQELILVVGPPDQTDGNKGGVNPAVRTSSSSAEIGAEVAKSRPSP